MNPIDNEIFPHIVYYHDDHRKTPKCTQILSEFLKVTFSMPDTWCDLITELENGCQFLAFHVDMIERSLHSTPIEFIDAITTIIRFLPNAKDLKIGVTIKPTTPLAIVRTLQKTQIQGILLDINHYSIEKTVEGLNAFINGIPYWPKEILYQLPGTVKKLKIDNQISLTTRQAEVLHYITKKGSSNKVIAKGLGIAESTVKLHVAELFKKYGVRSRTQLAVFSQTES